MNRLAFLGLAALLAGACQSDRVANPSSARAMTPDAALQADGDWGGSGLPAPDARPLRVMQYNLYLGANLGPIFQAPAEQVPMAIYLAWVELQQTDFPARAGAIANQIAKVQPDLLGIEEVARWSVSPDYTYGAPPTQPFAVQYDFLQTLLDSLAARGLVYTAPAVDATSDVTVPVLTGVNGDGVPTGVLVNFQDRDAVLVRAGVAFGDPQHGVYQAAVPVVLGENTLYIRNGWSSVRASSGGRSFRFLVTHLNAEAGVVNGLQAGELLSVVQGETDPVILAGDFNTGPGVAPDFADAYRAFARAGFADLWLQRRPADPGLTNGPNDGVGYLDESGALVPWPSLDFRTRVDLVLVRDPLGPPQPVHAATFGYLPGDRTASGLWPSDHAAVGVTFELTKRPADR